MGVYPYIHHINDVMVSVLASIVVDHGFEMSLDQTENYKIGICCFSAKQTALWSKSKDTSGLSPRFLYRSTTI